MNITFFFGGNSTSTSLPQYWVLWLLLYISLSITPDETIHEPVNPLRCCLFVTHFRRFFIILFSRIRTQLCIWDSQITLNLQVCDFFSDLTSVYVSDKVKVHVFGVTFEICLGASFINKHLDMIFKGIRSQDFICPYRLPWMIFALW